MKIICSDENFRISYVWTTAIMFCSITCSRVDISAHLFWSDADDDDDDEMTDRRRRWIVGNMRVPRGHPSRLPHTEAETG